MRKVCVSKGIIAMLCLLLTGCAGISNPFTAPVAGVNYYFPKPNIVRVAAPAAAPEEITYEYSRLTGNDFAFAVAAAERECRAGGKAAQVVSMLAKNQERSWATFVCR